MSSIKTDDSDLVWALEAYIQANTNSVIRNSGSRGTILDDAMAALAMKIGSRWYRDRNGVWQHGRKT